MGGFDLTIDAKGDLDVDQHHTVEDVVILIDGTAEKSTRRSSKRDRWRGLYDPPDG